MCVIGLLSRHHLVLLRLSMADSGALLLLLCIALDHRSRGCLEVGTVEGEYQSTAFAKVVIMLFNRTYETFPIAERKFIAD